MNTNLEQNSSNKRSRRSNSTVRDYGVLGTLIGLFITLAFCSDAFLTRVNLGNIASQSAPIGILACGATIVIISGGFDLSAGGIYAICGVIAAEVANSTTPLLGLLAGVVAGLIIGIANGIVITILRINPFIATLATGLLLRGIATVITNGALIRVDDDSFEFLSNSRIFGLKFSVYIFAFVALLASFMLTRTRLGRYIHAVGGNSEASRLSGIRVDGIRIAAFALSGVLAGLAGVVATSRVATGQADVAIGIELIAIAAVIVGGSSPAGGKGAIWRSIVGVFLLSLIANGFNLININPFYLPIVQGLIILFAVGSDSWSQGNIQLHRVKFTKTKT
jgi:ribose transport system permease protein